MISRRELKPYVAEFLGTALLIVIGDGVVAQCLLSNWYYGTWLSINLAWASAVALSGYLADPSPSINPAATLALALVRPSAGQWRQIPGKLAAQFLGGFVGAAIVYINYRSAIKDWDPEYTIPGGSILSPTGHHSAGIFSTYPAAFFKSNWEGVFSEGLGAAVLMFVRLLLLLLMIGAALGWQTGYAINPARDFGPRLFSAILYGREVFTAANYYFVVPLFAPIIGCIVGAATYDSLLFEGEGSRVTDALDKAEGHGSLRLD
ncbi:uncharacterized protein N7506_007131 [Penicillium brevicompactum]|uniref:uncharacterized protein n=1 Tax=Penicillium brevicompactum TaxID=5074 RepID=UPI00254012F8|nr:uncharacterized protein N7506_007131 [Penicillium brevicompactum]KAJ5333348.1 hypothetical protein N7506_007131 [Penicillium brevicompactum]